MVIIDFLGDVKGSWGNDIVPVFLCKIAEEPIVMEPEKFREWRWFSKEEMPDDFINGEINNLIHKIL